MTFCATLPGATCASLKKDCLANSALPGRNPGYFSSCNLLAPGTVELEGLQPRREAIIEPPTLLQGTPDPFAIRLYLYPHILILLNDDQKSGSTEQNSLEHNLWGIPADIKNQPNISEQSFCLDSIFLTR